MQSTVAAESVEANRPQAAMRTAASVPPRNIAVDAYRGLVMMLMMGEVLNLPTVAHSFSNSILWRVLAYNQTHVEWAGLSLHDTIQPSFTFLVGIALPYSIVSRTSKGQSFRRQLAHTVWRSLVLVALGIFLRSTESSQTNFTCVDTLTQIGLGYTFAFLLARCRPKWQWIALTGILVGYWLAWAVYPAPGAGFNYATVGVPANWPYNFSGFASHWNKNSNLGQAFDLWFLNLFPRAARFAFNPGGYLTLSFIPTLGTMLLGLRAGEWLRSAAPKAPVRRFLVAGIALVAVGLMFHWLGICPIVKRIWTPSWTLFSGGVCFLFLAVFSWIIDIKAYRRWAFPLVVVGMNSIAAYLIAGLGESFIMSSLHIHFGYQIFQLLGKALEPLMLGIAVMSIYWLILFWMYRKRIFLRI